MTQPDYEYSAFVSYRHLYTASVQTFLTIAGMLLLFLTAPPAVHAQELPGADDAKEHLKKAWQADKADHFDEAVIHYRHAIKIYKRIADETPKDLRLTVPLSNAHYDFGGLLDAEGETEKALAEYQIALAIFERIRASPFAIPEQTALPVSLIHNRIAQMQSRLLDWPAALASYRQSLAGAERRLDQEPENPQAIRQVATRHNGIAKCQIQLGQIAEALKSIEKVQAIVRPQLQKAPDDFDYLLEFGTALTMISDIHSTRKEIPEAIYPLKEAVSAYRKLTLLRPKQRGIKLDTSVKFYKLGALLLELTEDDGALSAFQTSSTYAQELLLLEPKRDEYRIQLIDSAFESGKIQLRRSQILEAQKTIAPAVDCIERMIEEESTNAHFLTYLIPNLDTAASIEVSSILFKTNPPELSRLSHLAEQALKNHPDDLKTFILQSRIELHTALILFVTKNPQKKEAEALLKKATQRMHDHKIQEKLPDDYKRFKETLDLIQKELQKLP